MAAWLLIAPPDVRVRPVRELYLERVDERGELHFTPHPVIAKRFASAGVARRWAAQHGDRLSDFTVGRR